MILRSRAHQSRIIVNNKPTIAVGVRREGRISNRCLDVWDHHWKVVSASKGCVVSVWPNHLVCVLRIKQVPGACF